MGTDVGATPLMSVQPMDCRRFRRTHTGLIDQTLTPVEHAAAKTHLAECADCARFDTNIRRALLVFWNLPAIRPSADFATRLNIRLLQLRALAEKVGHEHRPRLRPLRSVVLYL